MEEFRTGRQLPLIIFWPLVIEDGRFFIQRFLFWQYARKLAHLQIGLQNRFWDYLCPALIVLYIFLHLLLLCNPRNCTRYLVNVINTLYLSHIMPNHATHRKVFAIKGNKIFYFCYNFFHYPCTFSIKSTNAITSTKADIMNSRAWCQICSKVGIDTRQWRHWKDSIYCFSLSIVDCVINCWMG